MAAKTSPPVSLSQSQTSALDNGNLEIKFTIPWETVSAHYQKTLKSLAAKAKIKGFRPGKAPANLVEKSLGKEKIYQELLKTLLTEIYLEALTTHKLRPVVNPQFRLISAPENQDWQAVATTAQLPEIKVEGYQEKVKKEIAPAKIWTPGQKTADKNSQDTSQKLSRVLEALLKTIPVKLPAILVEEEVNRLLSRLIDQTGRLGITVDQYLASINKKAADIKDEYRHQAEESLKLELILAAIADNDQVKVDENEIEKMIQATKDGKVKTDLSDPNQKAYLRQILRKRKVLDNLAVLA